MYNKNWNKGFTLMELLIVVAIIAVLVAIAIPMFTAQLEKSRDAASVANMRSAYAEAAAGCITSDGRAVAKKGNVTVSAASSGSQEVTVENVVIESQVADNWSNGATHLPFTAPEDTGSPDTYTMTFTFDLDSGSCGTPTLTS